MLLAYIIRRILWSIPFLFVVSLIAFALIQAPPGDYITTFAATLAASGDVIDQERLDALRERYGLDQPFLVQYWRWISGVLQGDFGISFEWQQPVSNLIWERMALSVTLALSTLLFTWAVAFPIGIYSAVRKYSIGDYVVTGDRLHRPRHAELPGRARADVHRRRLFRRRRLRPVLRASTRRRPGPGPRSSTCSPISGSR